MSTIGYYQINIVQGDDYKLNCTNALKDCATNETIEIDLSNISSIESKLLDKNNDLIVEFTTAVEDAEAGKFSISLTDTQTAGISGMTSKVCETIGSYYIRFITTDDQKTVKLRGKASLTSVEGF